MKAEKSGVGLLNDIERWRTRAKRHEWLRQCMTVSPAMRCCRLQMTGNRWLKLAEESQEYMAAEAVVKLIPGHYREPIGTLPQTPKMGELGDSFHAEWSRFWMFAVTLVFWRVSTFGQTPCVVSLYSCGLANAA
jgi:hypothetical protein